MSMSAMPAGTRHGGQASKVGAGRRTRADEVEVGVDVVGHAAARAAAGEQLHKWRQLLRGGRRHLCKHDMWISVSQWLLRTHP
jgi:hypothetical protein